MNHATTLHSIEIAQETLLPMVRRVTRRDGAELVDWQTQSLQGGIGDMGTGRVGVFRCTGHITDQGEIIPWSIVLKSAQGNADQETADYFTREWFAYHSGFLGGLSGSVVAPQCFGTEKRTKNQLWIWMEYLGNISDYQWTMASYAQVARSFGMWNGAYLVGEMRPDFSWFCPSTASEWMQQAEPSITALRLWIDHPVIQRLYPDQQANVMLRLWDERRIFLEALKRLPQTVCHNDAFCRNLHIRHADDRSEQVVAFDWANFGLGAVGEELAAMVVANLAFGDVPLAQAIDFTEVVFQAYLKGLRQVGWDGDERLVRLGFIAAAALKYGFPYLLDHLFSEEGQVRLQEILNQAQVDNTRGKAAQRFVLSLAEEARTLLHVVRL